MSKALELTATNFEQEVINSDVPVLVDFWAPWCGPCQLMGPVLDAISEEFSGRVKVAKLNVEDPDNQQIAAQYNIRSIPNMKLFKEGKVVHDMVGAHPKDSLKKEIEAKL